MTGLRAIDSHTEGEPTRVLIEGAPVLRGAAMAERRDELQREWNHLRTALTAEPRASEGCVAAFLTDPVTDGAVAGVIFANRAGYLQMCGHGTIGVARTLRYLGRIAAGTQRFTLDTPAGTISVQSFDDGSVEICNVVSRAYQLDVALDVPGVSPIAGDIVYGGNWFFLADVAQFANVRLELERTEELTAITKAIQAALDDQRITGEDGARIDHVELYGPPERADADAKNFVLCPDGAYDRSPCGTGTSAKMAVLAARGELKPGDVWHQESITGTLFTGHYEPAARGITPFVRGRAFITGETTIIFDTDDPLMYGVAAPTSLRFG